MDPESKQLLQNTFNLATENNKMLRKIRRSQKIASFMRIVYWIIIIGITAGAFYFFQPYLEQAKGFIQDSGIDIDQIKGLNNLPR